VVLRFRGDDEHSPTTKTVRVVFTKYPVAITLHGPSRATVGKAATFRGNVTIPGRAVLEVYVNGKKNITVVSRNGGFSFRLTPEKRGRFKVYVTFEGNEEYQKAVSNAVVLEAVPPANPLIRYVELALVALLLVGVVVAGRRRAARVENPEPIAERTKGGSAEERRGVPSDVGEAYTLLRSLLSRKLGISESLTPREALEALRDWELYPELEKATLLHEKAVYGGAALTPEEAAEFKWAVENIMRGLADTTIKYLILTLLLFTLVTMPMTVPMFKSSTPYSMFNRGWDGTSQFAALAREEGMKVVPLFEPLTMANLSRKSGVLMIIGPDVPFTAGEIEQIQKFLQGTRCLSRTTSGQPTKSSESSTFQ